MSRSISIIAPTTLKKVLGGDQPVSLVDTRPNQEFRKSHIPSAVNIEWEKWCEEAPRNAAPIIKEPGYWGALADPLKGNFAERLEAYGLSHDRKIVVYDGGQASKGRAGRVAWMLLYLGCHEVVLLDGGFPAWLASGGSSDNADTKVDKGSFKISITPERRCDLHAVRCRSPRTVLVDTRSKAEFAGRVFDYQPRKGHIPGSVLIAYKDLFDKKGDFISVEAYENLLAAAGARGELFAYCEVGVRAALFALIHETHTGQIVPVFDGSFMQWAFDDNNPVANT